MQGGKAQARLRLDLTLETVPNLHPALGLHSAGDVLRETTLLMSPQRRGLIRGR